MDLLKKKYYKAKIKKIEGTIPITTGLATANASTAVENKTPNVIEIKYFATTNYNKFMPETLDIKIKV